MHKMCYKTQCYSSRFRLKLFLLQKPQQYYSCKCCRSLIIQQSVRDNDIKFSVSHIKNPAQNQDDNDS